jgi:ABC-type sugar transport system substrate-binding protein
MKKALLILLVIVFAVSMSVFSFACQAEPAEETAAEAETTAAAEAKDVSDLEIVYIVKVDGIVWFDTERAGLDQCAADYGFKATTVGPATADPALQAQMVEDYIAAGADAIGVCPNDPGAITGIQECTGSGNHNFRS